MLAMHFPHPTPLQHLVVLHFSISLPLSIDSKLLIPQMTPLLFIEDTQFWSIGDRGPLLARPLELTLLFEEAASNVLPQDTHHTNA